MLLVAALHPDVAKLSQLFWNLVVLYGFILYTLYHRAATILPQGAL